MDRILRNIIVYLAVTFVWVFFFVPNSALSFLNVSQLQGHISNIVLFVFVPLVLSMTSMFLVKSTLAVKVVLSLCVPIAGVALCLIFWLTGIYSDESLLGAWLLTLPPIVAHVVGVIVAIALLRRGNRNVSGANASISN